jgi:hypothetical protein
MFRFAFISCNISCKSWTGVRQPFVPTEMGIISLTSHLKNDNQTPNLKWLATDMIPKFRLPLAKDSKRDCLPKTLPFLRLNRQPGSDETRSDFRLLDHRSYRHATRRADLLVKLLHPTIFSFKVCILIHLQHRSGQEHSTSRDFTLKFPHIYNLKHYLDYLNSCPFINPL